MIKKALCIAGSDCSGGAGIQADLKTFSAHGVFGMSVIISVVAENTKGVIGIENISPDMIKKQIEAVFDDIGADAVKIGMLADKEHMLAVCESLKKYKPQNIVIDPVMYAKDSSPLMDPNSADFFIDEILPLADVITPNIPEAQRLSDIKISDINDMKKAADIIHSMGAKAVLVKGGHSNDDNCADILFDGKDFHSYSAERIFTKNTHGTGCTLSSAIAANLALGKNISQAVLKSKIYITNAIKNSPAIGTGYGPLDHFYNFRKSMGDLK